MTGLSPEVPNIVKRTTLLVRDMAASRRWYEYVQCNQVTAIEEARP